MKMTKKFFKESEQRNVELAKMFYSEKQLKDMSDQGLIFQINYDGDYRVPLRDVDKLDIVREPILNSLVVEATMKDSDSMLWAGVDHIYVVL